jgi:putative ABC transport system permease protein
MKLLPWEYAVRNLGRSPLRTVLGAGGAGLVVLLVMAAGAFVRGMQQSLRVSGSPDNVILLGAGSEESVERSEIDSSAAGQVQAGIRGIRSLLDVAFVSPEVHLAMELGLERDDPTGHSALLRGVTPAAFLVHQSVRIVAGRAPMPGADEMMVGALAATRMGVSPARLAVGQTLWLDGRPWTISGHFESPGTVLAAEIWLPLSDLQIAARRDSLSCIIVTLDGADFDDVDAFCKQRLDLELVAMRETDYYANLADFYAPVRAMVWITAALIATGGLLGGLNTMYAVFAARVRELGTLQTIGFSRRAIVVSFVQESLLSGLAGALVAAALAMALLDSLAVRFSMGAFGLIVDSTVVLWGLAAAMALGVAGALPPAWRCLRLEIPVALKAA